MASRPKLPTPIQIEDGKWYAVAFTTKGEEGQPFTEECCECSAVHRVNYKVENGLFWVQYNLDSKLTRRARAQRKGR